METKELLTKLIENNEKISSLIDIQSSLEKRYIKSLGFKVGETVFLKRDYENFPHLEYLPEWEIVNIKLSDIFVGLVLIYLKNEYNQTCILTLEELLKEITQ
jgi:hypothetical protein